MAKTVIELKTHDEAEVISLPVSHSLNHRLREMGIRPGKVIARISSQAAGGPVVVSVNGQQTAISRTLASQIKVSNWDK